MVLVVGAAIGVEPAIAQDTVTQPAPAKEQQEPAPVAIHMESPVSVSHALETARAGDVEIREIVLGGNGIIGGLTPLDGVEPTAHQEWLDAAFANRFGTTPVVTGLTVDGSADRGAIARLAETLDRLPVARAGVSAALPRLPSSPTDPRPHQDLDSHFPSIWIGNTYRSHYPSGLQLRAYDNWFQYESAYGAWPHTYPIDWGMEIGITSYKGGIPSVRPYCPPGADTDYWSGSYDLGGLWGTNVAAAAAPYADHAIYSDSCNDNSAELGVGHPEALAVDTTYLLFVELMPGNRGASDMSAAMSMMSDDCNDLGSAPHTDCMGLNVNRQPPTGFDKVNSLVNKARGWTLPGCFAMADGLADPIRTSSGSSGCPWDVYY